MKIKKAFILKFVFLISVCNSYSQDWRSELYPYHWKPGFAKDGKYIQDFSYAGYRKGEQAIPFITNNIIDVTQAPYNADKTGTNNATAAIQAAIDYVSGLGGGVVFLPAGTYNVQPNGASTSALSVRRDGVVIRGAGVSQTRILNTQTNMRSKSIISFEPSTEADWYSPSATPVPFVKNVIEHDTTVFVANASSFSIGDRVVLTTDLTDEWIAEHNMKGLWNSTMPGVAFSRTIKNINATTNSITVDIPIRYFLKTRDNARIYKINRPISECGLESLSIGNLQNNKTGWGDDDYAVAGTAAFEVHNSHAIKMTNAENCWMKNVATYKPAANTLDVHVLSHSFRMVQCRLITVDACDFMKPQYKGEGGNGYMYILESNDCLIKDSKATNARHSYSFRLASSNGNVIYNCLSKDPRLASDFHMWFSMANLFDNQICDKDFIEAVYRPYGGTLEHGQTTTQSVIWNTNGLNYQTGETAIVQSAQWGQGYVIGTRGAAPNVLRPSGNNSEPIDHLEGQGRGTQQRPASLYIDQLNRRLNGLGFIDNFGMNANIIPQVSLIAPLDEAMVDVSTTVTISATASDADGSITKVEFYRGTTLIGTDTTTPYSINWTPATAGTFVITARAYDNNGVTNNTAAASVIVGSTITTTLNTTADSYVTGGTNADTNYNGVSNQGSLIVKNNPGSISNTSKSVLKFDVTGQTKIQQAKVRLFVRFGTPNSITAYQTTDGWTENGVTWNNLPALGSQMGTVNFTTTGYKEWDVTAYVQSQAAGDGVVSLIFQDDAVANIQLGFSSKEFGSNPPELVLVKSAVNSPPIISLTAPSSGTVVDVSTAVTISATAADNDGSITRVDFYNGTTLIRSDNTAPYSFSWIAPSTVGSYAIKAKAFDNDGDSTSSITSYLEVKSLVITTLNPIADSYIQAGTNANVNYGTNTSLIIMNSATSVNSVRKSILKFDLTGKTGIQQAKVRIFVRFGSPNSITAYQTTDAWTESGITWNNAPPTSTQLGTNTITANGYWEWDVTSYVQSQAAGDGLVSFMFQDDAVVNLQLGINSKEFGSSLPELVLSSSNTLPVELTSFLGRAVDQSILLNWTTASEQNSDLFNVLNSSDGKNFKNKGSVLAAGNSNSTLHYYFKDDNPHVGNNYYQLQQVDKDGSVQYSSVIQVKSNLIPPSITAHAKSTALSLNIFVDKSAKTSVFIFNIGGQQIAKQEVSLEKGYNQFQIPMNLQSGVYLVKMILNDKLLVQKVISN
jgi:hypothetical protein